MKKFDLAGTLMHKDTPLADFVIKDGVAVEFKQLSTENSLFPFEMIDHPTGSRLVDALLARVVPETRQGLLERLEKVGIHGYNLSEILRFQNASCFDDENWVRFSDGPQSWKELRMRLGYTTY